MGYVMVPVPEAHVQEVMQTILRLVARARLSPWDKESLAALFHDIDEPSRSVISVVARATAARGSIGDQEAADTIEMTQREVLGIVRELNERAQAEERFNLFLVSQESEVLPNGRTRDRRTLALEKSAAAPVAEVEREELASSSHPLLSGDG